MRSPRFRAFAAVGLLCGGAIAALALGRPERAAVAQATAPVPSAEIAIIATPHSRDAEASDVRFVTVGASARSQHVARVPHAAGAVVRGDLLRGARAVVVAADVDGPRDRRDWSTALYRVDESGQVRLLASGLYHASRPLASRDGEVFVERGVSGPWPAPEEARAGMLRTDALRVDAIDPDTGAARTVYTSTGYTLHLAGEWERELVVYRVAFGAAELLGVDRQGTGAARTIASVPPFARDFSVDASAGALVMSNRDDADSRLWVIERVDLRTGARTRVASERDEAPAPFALPDGSLAFTKAGRGGLSLASRALAPLGPGFDAVTHTTDDGAWLTMHHVAPGGFDVAAAVHVATSTSVRLSEGDERVEVLGILGASRGGVR